MKIFLAIIIIVALVAVGFAIGGYFFFRNGGSSISTFNYSDPSSYNTGDGTIREKVKSVEINWSVGDIEIVEYDGNHVVLEETAVRGSLDDDLRLRWKTEGSKLRIQYARAGKNLDLKGVEKKLVVKIPSSVSLDELEIDVVSSNSFVSLDGIRELDWNSVNGNLDARLKTLEEADLDTVNGNATLHVSSKAPSKVEFDCVNGDLTLSIPKDSSFTLTRESINGGFDCDFPVKVEGKDKYISGSGKNNYKAESVNGYVSIKAI